MYHIVYRTVNIINDKYYIGVHSTQNINDGYLGSGSAFKNALLKYGKENFIREVLFVFPTRQEAMEKEFELVTMEVLADLNCYNLIVGGYNGVQTTKEKRALMPVKVETVFYDDTYCPNYKYSIRPHVVYGYRVATNSHNVPTLLNHCIAALFEPNIWQRVSDMYNSKKFHELGVKYIGLLERFQCYKYSIGIYRTGRTTLVNY